MPNRGRAALQGPRKVRGASAGFSPCGRRVAVAPDLAGVSNTEGAPSFAAFAKGGRRKCLRNALAEKYPVGYNKPLNTLLRSSDFDVWLSQLADQKAKARILARLASATFGNFGDCEPIGEGVSEMRIHVGAGYRVYYTRTGSTVYVLLAGGVKASQTKDIAKAKKMARELKRAKP